VRRGYFVEGLPGVQYGMPEAVETLRSVKDSDDSEVIVLNAVDPANLFGGEVSTAPFTAGGTPLRFSHLASNYVVAWRGQPILLAENSAASLTTTAAAEHAPLREGLGELLKHLTAPGGICSSPRRLTVNEWNGQPVLRSSGQPLLESLDFYRDPPAMTWDGH
jgi:ATP-dependent helicase Lhr and Lhr-like helicase